VLFRSNTSVVVLHKQRVSGTKTDVIQLVGDVRDRPCLIVDDIIATGGTIAESIDALLAAGARSDMVVVATHGVFTNGARHNLNHVAVREVFVTNTIGVETLNWPRLQVVSVGPLIAAAINGRSSPGQAPV